EANLVHPVDRRDRGEGMEGERDRVRVAGPLGVHPLVEVGADIEAHVRLVATEADALDLERRVGSVLVADYADARPTFLTVERQGEGGFGHRTSQAAEHGMDGTARPAAQDALTQRERLGALRLGSPLVG